MLDFLWIVFTFNVVEHPQDKLVPVIMVLNVIHLVYYFSYLVK